MRCASIAFWVCSGLFACDGAEPPPPKTPAAVSVVSEEPDVAPEPAPATIVDMVERDADIFGYFDADEFRRGPMYRAIRNVVDAVPLARVQLSSLIETCGFDPIEALLEFSLSSRMREGRPDFKTVVLVARTNTSSAASLDCLARLVPPLERAEIDGHPALGFGDAGGYIVGVEPFLIAGQPQMVQRAMERLEGGARVRVPDEILYAELRAADLFEAERIVVKAADGPRGTEWSVLARATSSEEAEKIESAVREFRQEALEELARSELEPSAQSLVAELIKSVTLERRGPDLAGGFSFGSPERETAILGALASPIVARLDLQLKSDRASDARSSLWAIAAELREYAMKQSPPRFPESGPLIPAQVPMATNTKALESEWQQGGWKDLRFRLLELQPYAFGFETKRGGREVTIRALGDLDGDGQQSRFEVDLEIRQGELHGGNTVREDNPLE